MFRLFELSQDGKGAVGFRYLAEGVCVGKLRDTMNRLRHVSDGKKYAIYRNGSEYVTGTF